MPIAFPRPTGPYRSVIESQWWAKTAKAFDGVPAPTFGSPKLSSVLTSRVGFSLDPGLAVRSAVNLRDLGRGYVDVRSTASVNPAGKLREWGDGTKTYNRVLGAQNNRIVGVSRDASGAALGDCVVKVFATASDVLVDQTVSDGAGNWIAYPNQVGPYYFVQYKAGSPDVFGTSPNTNTATTFTPGA